MVCWVVAVLRCNVNLLGFDSGVLGPLLEVVELVRPDNHYCVIDYLCRLRGGTTISDLHAGDDAMDARIVRLDELDDYGVSDAVKRVIERAVSLVRC